MNRIRDTKAVDADRRDVSDGTHPLSVTVAAPDGGDLSEQGRDWQRENRAAINCYNEWIAEQGLPLEDFRRF